MSRESHLLRGPLKHELLLFVAQLGRRMEEIVISGRHRAAIHDGCNRRGHRAYAALHPEYAQFEKFRTARPLFAPNRYDGANFALQEPLPRSEWQSKQEFARAS